MSESSGERLGTLVVESSSWKSVVRRRTRETLVEVSVWGGERSECLVSTGSDFLNHMVEILSLYSGFNINARVETLRYRLLHTISEDLGITMGRAFKEIADKRMSESGIKGHGYSIGVLDEARAIAVISYEGRTGSYVSVVEPFDTSQVEDIKGEYLKAFFDGFSQGMRATIQVEVVRAGDPHHAWESAFRAFGASIREALRPDEWRKNTIPGVKGTID